MKKVYLHGSFMNDNYGDFLLYYIINNICKKYSDSYTFFSSSVDKTYDNYCKINRKSKIEAIFKSNYVIFAGGGYFGEPDYRKMYWNIRCFFIHLLPAYIISLRKIPYIILGVEAGPMKFWINRFMLKRIITKAEVVSVRNEESLNFLKNIGVQRKILNIPDWVMGIDKNILIDKNNNYISNIIKNIKNNYTIIILVHLTSRNSEGMDYVIQDLVKYINENKNVFYIIGCDQDRDIQKKRAEELSTKFPSNRSLVINYLGPWVLSSLINSVDAVITDKLHVGIVAIKMDKEVISVANNNKSVKFHTSIGRSYYTKHLNMINKGETYEKLKSLSFKNICINKKIFIEAEKNEKLLIDFLNYHSRE